MNFIKEKEMHLYEITGDMMNAIQKYNEVETDEALLELEKELNGLQLSFNEKAITCAHYTINVKADIEAIEKEVERLNKKKESLDGGIKWMKRYLQSSMEVTRTDKIESPTVKISIQNNPPSVVIDDENLIPESYKRTIPERKEIDKIKIKDAWKQNIGVEGTHIEQTKSLRIK